MSRLTFWTIVVCAIMAGFIGQFIADSAGATEKWGEITYWAVVFLILIPTATVYVRDTLRMRKTEGERKS